MDGRTVIKKAIDFDNPERIGFCLDSPYPNDFTGFGPMPREDFDYSWHDAGELKHEYGILAEFDGFVRRDEYGNIWAKMRDDPSQQGEVIIGALQDWDMLDSYRFPDYSDVSRYSHIPDIIAKNPDKYRLGGISGGFPFKQMQCLRKLEDFLVDLLTEQDRVSQLNEMVVCELLKVIDIYGQYGADGIMFYEDWGTQDRLIISPELWRKMFKPSFEKLCARAHSYGMHVIMHSCGYVYEIIGDLIEVGIDVLQFDSPTLMGIDRLAREFGGKVAFFGGADIQRVLPTGNRETIINSVREMIDKFGCFGGGFIARDYGDYRTLRIKDEWVDWMREAFVKYGYYR